MVDVEHLLGKTAALLDAEHAQRPNRVHQHTHGRHGEILPVKPPQGIRYRCHEVGATADRLGDEYLGAAPLGQPVRRLDQRVEPAAKTAAGDFLGREPLRAQHGRVHEVASLVVGDEPHAQPLPGQPRRQFGHRRRLAGAEESPDHDIPRLARAAGRPAGGLGCRHRFMITAYMRKCAYAFPPKQPNSPSPPGTYFGSLSNRKVQQPSSSTFLLAASWFFRRGTTA